MIAYAHGFHILSKQTGQQVAWSSRSACVWFTCKDHTESKGSKGLPTHLDTLHDCVASFKLAIAAVANLLPYVRHVAGG